MVQLSGPNLGVNCQAQLDHSCLDNHDSVRRVSMVCHHQTFCHKDWLCPQQHLPRSTQAKIVITRPTRTWNLICSICDSIVIKLLCTPKLTKSHGIVFWVTLPINHFLCLVFVFRATPWLKHMFACLFCFFNGLWEFLLLLVCKHPRHMAYLSCKSRANMAVNASHERDLSGNHPIKNWIVKLK